MRDDIFPTWEDPDNRLGGCISFKVFSKDIVEAWNKLFLKLISEDITTETDCWEEINGIKFEKIIETSAGPQKFKITVDSTLLDDDVKESVFK